MRLTVEQLIEILQDEEINPKDEVIFDVKKIDGCQDFGQFVDTYWDGELIIELR